jgi:hypothetical protein
MDGVKFENIRSVKFNLDGFAVPVIKPKSKNTIYTERVQNASAAKNTLTKAQPVNNYGYSCSTKWRNYVFAGGNNGLFVADESLSFVLITNYFFPTKMFVKNNRMFTINSGGGIILYSVDLTGSWNAQSVMEGVMYIPNEFGKCIGLTAYKNDLLLVCETALAVVDKKLNLKFLTDNSEVLLSNMSGGGDTIMWESAYFGLGYATDTQMLREVFVKTDTPITLFAVSNKVEKIVNVTAGGKIQKVKINLRGDLFKLKIIVPTAANNFTVSNISAVISYGKRGE